MAVYIEITDAEVAPNAPGTTSLFTRLRDNALSYLGAPTGTKMLFRQTAAPLGWTKNTDHDDKALRLVSGTVGSGGTAAFSTVFGKTATDGFALLQTHLPDVTLPVTDPGHTHSQSQTVNNTEGGTGGGVGGGQNVSGNSTMAIQPASTGISVRTGGGNTAHTHAMDIRVQYADVIEATKA